MVSQLELSQLISSLRTELVKAQSESEGKEVRFTVEDVELELEISAEEQGEGGIAAKFYVFTTQFKASKKDAVTQRIKLKLKPQEESMDRSTGNQKTSPLKIGGKVKAKK
jgi:Trypsin-co-occurring domain 2